MGCCHSIKQFEHTENNDWALKHKSTRKRKRSEARSRHHQNEDLEDKQKSLFQTYNYYYGGIPHPYTHRQGEAFDRTAREYTYGQDQNATSQDQSATRTPVIYLPLHRLELVETLPRHTVDPLPVSPDDIEKEDCLSVSQDEIEKGNNQSVSPDDIEKGDNQSVSPDAIEKGDNQSVSPGDIEKGDNQSVSPDAIEKGDNQSVSPDDIEDEKPTFPNLLMKQCSALKHYEDKIGEMHQAKKDHQGQFFENSC